jgi:DNA invertase Pin-like site-specific DNA recombinase
MEKNTEDGKPEIRKAFAYLRVSSEGQVDGDGFPRQREAIKKWAASHNVKIVRWFEEKGVSGTKELTDRPALSELMVALMSNGVRLVVVEKLDRIARDQMVQEGIIQSLLKEGFELVSAAPGEENLCGNEPGRKLMRTIMGAIAEYDKQMIVLKLRAARSRTKAKEGRCEGRKPFGHYENEREVLTRMSDLHAGGGNWETIAATLNNEGIKTRSGGKWFPATVRKILIRKQSGNNFQTVPASNEPESHIA